MLTEILIGWATLLLCILKARGSSFGLKAGYCSVEIVRALLQFFLTN
jgi:hypothetical protein